MKKFSIKCQKRGRISQKRKKKKEIVLEAKMHQHMQFKQDLKLELLLNQMKLITYQY